MKRFWTVFIIAFIFHVDHCQSLFGQHNGYEHNFDMNLREEYVPEITSDMSLFFAPLDGASSLFQKLSLFNFSSVRYLPRGYDRRLDALYINGIDVGSGHGDQPDYPLIMAISRVSAPTSRVWGLSAADDAVGGVGVTAKISVRAADMPVGNSVTLSSSDRRYRFGIRAASVGTIADGKWNYAVTGSRRWGRDGHIKGVFSQDNVVSIALEGKLKKEHTISLFSLIAPCEQGTRSASTREAFELTDNNLYNPSWGYYGGKERNSRVRNSLQPIIIATYDGRISERTKVTASVSTHFGKSRYSSLAWYDAQTPYPDYYRLMPSNFPDQPLGTELDKLWRAADKHVVLIDWDELVYQNQMANDNAIYIVEDRVENMMNNQMALIFRTKVNDRLSVCYGARLKSDKVNNYKQAKDLLGADRFLDVDSYLIGDELWGDKLNNNMREPDRVVHRSDRFGYNYDIVGQSIGAHLIVKYAANRYRLWVAAEGASLGIERDGHYQKELLPGSASYGKSKGLRFTTYTLKAGGGYSISPRQSLDISFLTSAAAPSVGSIFISPDYSNAVIEHPTSVLTDGVELNYALSSNVLKFSMAAFYTMTRHQSQIYHYFDDISQVYSNLIMSDISKRNYGVELGAQVVFGGGLLLNMAASLGRYTYNNMPLVDIQADVDSRIIVSGDRSHLRNFRLGSTPQSVVSGELRYSYRGWLATATISYMADSYVNVSPVRRMARVYELADSPEKFAQFTAQEKLPNVATVDIFLLKSFNIGKSRMYAILSVKNLMGRNNIIHSGYEQMRIRGTASGANRVYSPFDTKYMYGYGRTYFCSMTYKF